ncbi:hypothetical protein GCM10028808_10680 [Spirosoma migulaei]
MEKLLEFWFDASLQGVAFLEPVRNSQCEVTDFWYRRVNTAFAHLLRQTKEELVGHIVRKVYEPTLENDFFHPLVAVLQTGEAQRLLKQYRLDGETVWHDVTLTRLDDLVMVNVQDVSEQKKSEYNLQRHLAMESILSAVASRFITLKTEEVDDYIVDALGQVSEYIGAERASVFIYSNDYQEGRCLHEWCAPRIAYRKSKIQTRPRECFDWMRPTLEKGETIRLQVDKLSPESIHEKAFFEFISVNSMIAVPLLQEQKTQGFVGFYTINKPQAWDQNVVSLLETFSTLVANVLYRLKQEAAIQRANHRLEGLHAIDQALLNHRLADQSPLSIAMNYMHFMVPCNRITVSQINSATGQIVVKCRVLEGKLDMNPELTVASHSLYERFLRNHKPNQPIYYPDLETDSTGIPDEINPYLRGSRSLVIIPLYRQEECIGGFSLSSVNPHFFTEEYQQIAQELAGPLAVVLYQQQLDDQLKHYTEQLEQRVEERTGEIRRLSTLHQAILRHAGQAIISTDIHGVIQTANQASENLLGYRVDELIGRMAYLEPGSPSNPLPTIAYRLGEQALPLANIFADALATQGYFYCECVAITKVGYRVPILLAASALQDGDGVTIGYVGISTDISALKTAEIQLQRKNQELNTFFEGALDMHCISDSQGNISEVNQAFQATLGYSAAELKSTPFLDLIHPDEQKFVYKNLLVDILQQPVRNQINRMRRKDGNYRVIEWNAIGIDNVVYGSARDSTERQENEIQLQNLNQRLKLATQAAGQGIWEIDMENDRVIWDDRVWEIFGLAPGRPYLSYQEFVSKIHPDDRPPFLERHNFKWPEDTILNVTRIVRPDGVVRYVKASGKVIRNEQEKPIRRIGVIWDVTEQERAEAALRESEQRFREIAENVDEVFWIHSANPFRLLYVNPAYERVWNTSFERLHENPYSFMDTVLKEDLAAVRHLVEQYKAGEEGQLYFRLKEKNKSVRWLFVRTFIIRDEAGTAIRQIGIINDVTSQKEKELVLQQALAREQELNQLKSQFVSTASHEFRTPLTTIQSSVDLIRLYLDLPVAKAQVSIQKHLAVIEKEIDQFSNLLTDILTIGRIEAGKISFRPKQVDIVSVCKEIIATHFNQRGDNRTVQFTVEGIPRQVFIDAKLISHVMVNLLSNAFKFSRTNPSLCILFNDNNFVLQVIDEGIGIPAKDLSTLFQAFFRASNTNGIPGTGLGLVIARQFVQLHSGHFNIESEEKKGTTCTIVLPIELASPTLPGLVTASSSLNERPHNQN